MARFVIDDKEAQSLFAQAFGYTAANLTLGIGQNNPATKTRYGTDLSKKDKYGVDCFAPVTLRYGSDEVFLPYATVNITTQKRIVKTNLLNRKGSVKEHISQGDYIITIRGVMLTRDEALPEDDISAIKDLYDTQLPISIINAITDFFLDRDDRIVIKSITLPPMIGTDKAQAFVLDCETDTNLELILE